MRKRLLISSLPEIVRIQNIIVDLALVDTILIIFGVQYCSALKGLGHAILGNFV